MTDMLFEQVLGEYFLEYERILSDANQNDRQFGEACNNRPLAHAEAIRAASDVAFALGVDFVGYALRAPRTFPYLSDSDVSDAGDVEYKAGSESESEPESKPVVAEPESVVTESKSEPKPVATEPDYDYEYEPDLDGYCPEPEIEFVSRRNVFEDANSDGLVLLIANHRGRTLLYTSRVVNNGLSDDKLEQCDYLS